MKKKIIGIGFVLMLMILTIPSSVGQELNNEPPLKVDLRMRKILPGLFIIKVSVVNLGNKTLSLKTSINKGGFIVCDARGEEIYHKPDGYTILILTVFKLLPFQHKTIYRGILNIRSVLRYTEYAVVSGFFSAYEYNGHRYPAVNSSPRIIPSPYYR